MKTKYKHIHFIKKDNNWLGYDSRLDFGLVSIFYALKLNKYIYKQYEPKVLFTKECKKETMQFINQLNVSKK